MIHAYDKIYLDKARTILARMLDYVVNDLEYKLSDALSLFITSGYASLFGKGDVSIIVGKSGVELAYEVLKDCEVVFKEPTYTLNRSEEYWVGWSFAYYQWYTDRTFEDILNVISADEVQDMYSPFHEMDVQQFVDHMDCLYRERLSETNLKRLRLRLKMTQRELANASNIPLRTLQQYEQRQKDINKAQGIYLYQLSKVLYCDIEDLMEKYIETL